MSFLKNIIPIREWSPQDHLFCVYARQVFSEEIQRMAEQGYSIEEIKVGMTARFSKQITVKEITLFSQASGDTNPMHLDPGFASRTRFKGCIAHGMLTASLISTVIGTQLPGPSSIYLQERLKFIAPVYPGDQVEVVTTVVAINQRRPIVTLESKCMVGEKVVLKGESKVMVE
jgi:3-hydroxybutyryl-CoA dehydratase|tara:strand:+ start:342 stop:860 length:519 start_codon:yes stop_codon:yes gene_type:complete